MNLQMLKSKIYNAVVTDVKLEYEGSITIDEDIYKKAGMHEFEKVLVVNSNNGIRFETYIIKGPKNSKEFCLNGAAARLAYKGDRIIIMSFGSLDEKDLKENYKPVIVRLDKENNIIK